MFFCLLEDLCNCGVIWLCVKPHLMSMAVNSIKASPSTLFISVAAGLTTETLEGVST